MKSDTLLKSHLAALIIVLFAYIPVIGQISNPNGELRATHPDLIWPQTMEGSHFNEVWNYQFYFENGTKAHIVFNIANFGRFKSPVSGVRLSVFNPDGSVHQLMREYPLDLLVQDKEKHMFRVRPERELYFYGKLPESHRIVINTVKDGLRFDIDLTLNNIQNGIQWGDGKFYVHNEEIGMVTHIPYAEASGHISIDDNRVDVKGTAYMDHTFLNRTTPQIFDSGYRFVYHEDSDNWDLIYFLLPENNDDNKTLGYRLKKTYGEVKLTGIQKIEQFGQGRAFDTSLPQNVTIQFEDESTLNISRVEDQEKISLLGEAGWLVRKAAKRIMGGEVIDFRGVASLDNTSRQLKKGEYNFFIID